MEETPLIDLIKLKQDLEADCDAYSDSYPKDEDKRKGILETWQLFIQKNPEHANYCIEVLLQKTNAARGGRTQIDAVFSEDKNSLARKLLIFILPKDEDYYKALQKNYLSPLSERTKNLQLFTENLDLELAQIKKGHPDQNTKIKEILEHLPDPVIESKLLLPILRHLAKIDCDPDDAAETARAIICYHSIDFAQKVLTIDELTIFHAMGFSAKTQEYIKAEFIRIKKLHQTIKITSENWNKLDTNKARNTFIYRFKRNNKSQLNDIFQLLIEQERNSPDFPQETSLFNRLFMSSYYGKNTTDRQIIPCLVWHLKKANIAVDEAKKIIDRFFKNNFENESPEMESLITEYYKNIDPEIYTLTAGMATTQGGARGRYAKEGNQDTCLKSPLDTTINTFTKKERAVLFKRSIAKLQEKYGQEEQQGSTAIACVVSGNTYDILNIGDSTAVLGRKNKTTGQVTFELINTIHNGKNSTEKKRLGRHKFNGTRLIVDRENPANRGLGVSRLIGYTQYPDVSHEPDTYHGTVHVKENEEGFIILASDGLSEADEYSVHTPGGFTEYLTERVNNFRGHVQQLPEYLIEKAIEDGSTDNITVAVIPLNTADIQPSVTAIFDGNNGDEISKTLQENFQATLEEEIDNQCQINAYLENLKKYRRIQGVRELVHILNNTTLSSKEVLAQYEAELYRKSGNADSIAERIENHNKAALDEIKKETEKFSEELKKEIVELSNKKTLGVIEITKQKAKLRNDLTVLVNTLAIPHISSEVKLKDYGTRFFELGIVEEIKKHPSSAGQKFLIAVSVILALTGIGAIGMGIAYLATHKWLWERSEKERVVRTAEKKVRPYTPRSAPAA